MKKLFGLIRLEFKAFELTAERLDFWLECFSGIPFEAARAGFKRHLQVSSFVPKPYDILKHVPILKQGITSKPTSSRILAMIRKYSDEYPAVPVPTSQP